MRAGMEKFASCLHDLVVLINKVDCQPLDEVWVSLCLLRRVLFKSKSHEEVILNGVEFHASFSIDLGVSIDLWVMKLQEMVEL